MISARTVKASFSHEAARPGSEASVRASEIPVGLSLGIPTDLFCAGSTARSPERRHHGRLGAECVCYSCFRSSLGGPSDRGLPAMTTSTTR
jgi:hypothetical protein